MNSESFGLLSEGERGPDYLKSTNRIRRTHWKTKLGCLECKRRHLKCDETRPSCQRCQVRNASCVYLSTHQSVKIILERQSPSRAAFSMDLSSTAEALAKALCLSDKTPSSCRRENLEGWHRFEAITSYTLGDPLACRAMRTEGMRIAFTSPTLMNAIIAIAIMHFCHLNPSYTPTVRAEYYWNRAISLFRQDLIRSVDPQNMDTMLSTCMMLAVHSFAVDGQSGSGSWALGDETMHNWLNIQGGLPVVLDKCQGLETSSIWHPVFQKGKAFERNYVETASIDPTFAECCGIDENEPGVENSPYYVPLQTLSAFQKIDISSQNLSKLLVFVGCLQGEYRQLIAKKDPCALLILGTWFALLSKIDQWWLQSRARLECRAICSYLEQSCRRDQRILDLLGPFAASCGYGHAGGSSHKDI